MRKNANHKRRIAISSKVFVGNLSFDASRQELETAFSTVGRIADILVPLNRSTNRPRGFAFVEFSEPGLAHNAIEQLDGVVVGGRPLRVSEARERTPRPAFDGGNENDSGPRERDDRPAWNPAWRPDRAPEGCTAQG